MSGLGTLSYNLLNKDSTALEQAKRLLDALIKVMQEVGEEVECTFKEQGDCTQCPIYHLFEESDMNLYVTKLKSTAPCEVF